MSTIHRAVKALRSCFAPLLLVVLALGASGCASVRAAAVTVNGHRVSQTSVDRELRAIAENKLLRLAKGRGTLSSGITATWLSVLVQQQVVDREVERRHVTVTATDRQEARAEAERLFGGADAFDAFPKWFRERVIERTARLDALLRSFAPPPSDAEVRNAYDVRIGGLKSQCPSGRFVARIVVKTTQEADTVAAQLAGGADFATLARKRSIDKPSAQVGGEVGCLGGELEPAVVQTAQTLALGTVSAPFQTQSGWNVIVVRDTIPFESVKELLRAQLEADTSKSRPKLDHLVAKARVELNARYGRWVVKDGRGQVTRPAGASPSTTAGSTP